jgi:competence protein ComEA
MIDFLRSVYSFKSLTLMKVISMTILLLLSSLSNPALSASPLDVNSATAEQLAAVMIGVGGKKAQAIIQYRTQNGAFNALDELIFVKGIGPSLLKKNREYLSIGPGKEYKGEKLADLPL